MSAILDFAATDTEPNALELRRLEAVGRYLPLDALLEPSMQRLARIATQVFAAPIGAVSLIGADTQFFACQIGFEFKQLDRQISFCDSAIASDEVLVVLDSSRDPRLASHPLVTGEMRIRFYAGAPLIAPDGCRVGTICVYDRQPRSEVTPSQLETLRDLAASAVSELELRRSKAALGALQSQSDEVKRRLTGLLNALPDLVLRISKSGEYLSAHGDPRQFLIPPSEFLGKNIAQVMPDALSERHREVVTRALESGQVVSMEYELGVSHYEARVAPCSTDEVVVVVRDLGPQRLAEQTLQRGYTFFADLAAVMGQGVAVTDPNGRLLYSNPAFSNLTSEQSQALFAVPLEQLVHRADQRLLRWAYAQNRAGQSSQTSLRLRRKGGWADVLLTCVPRKSKAGFDGSVVVATDLSERVRFERSLERERDFSHAVTEDAEFIVVVTDADGRVTRLNPCAAKTLDTSEAAVRGQPIWTLFSDPKASLLVQRVMRRLQGNTEVATGELSWLDGLEQQRHASLSCSLLYDPDGSSAHIVITGIDTSARRRSELQARVAQARAVEALKARSEFLNYVTHELRTPIHAISGFCELLLDPVSGTLTAEQADFALEINRASNHLFSLVSDLLDLAKVGANKVPLESRFISTKTLLQSCVAMVEAAALRSQVSLAQTTHSNSQTVYGAERQLRQIIVNLLDNAIKFTSAGGSVRLASSVTKQWLQISVTDSGIGIPVDNLETIFEPFTQASNSPTHHRSFGLGLTLAQRLAELHGGRLEVTSQLGVGSTFTLLLPRRTDA